MTWSTSRCWSSSASLSRDRQASSGGSVFRKAVFALALVVAAVTASVASVRFAHAQSPGVVRGIVVEGTQRIEPATVRSYLLIQVGDPFDPSRIDRSLKSLFATGLFADVAISRRGDNLVVKVVENPIISRIAFEGNERIKDETLEEEISLKPRVIYTRTKVQSDVRRILTLYRRSGRFAATVEPKVIQLPENRVDLVFEIDEGPKTEIASIRFVGNKAFSDSELRSVIRTRETAWWRFLSSEDTYDPDRLTLDQELLRRFYLSEGYADFRVTSAVAELTPDRREFFLTFTVEEGERYRFGDIGVETTLPGLSGDAVREVLTVEKGDWYDVDQVEKSIEQLSNKVGTLGYAFVEVRPNLSRNREKREINITFEINEGPRVFVERIEIDGNVRTLDKVIRREFRLVEGDPFNGAKVRRSRQRIQGLDFFESVDIEEVPGSAPDKAIIRTHVKEKSTGNFSFGAGYSTTSGAIGDVTLQERNFLGRGQDLKARVLVAQRDSQARLSFTEPYFLDREITAGIDLFYVTVDRQTESSFNEQSFGGALRFGYPLAEHLRQSWSYTLKQTKIDDVPDTASVYIQDAQGTDVISKISQSLLYDRRNSRIRPTEGYFARWSIGIAGLGGDVAFVRNVLDGGYYYPLAEKWTLSVLGSTGYITGIGQDVRVFDRFFVGGDNLRGFETSGVGPRDTRTNDALGGQWFYTGTLQVSFPLPTPEEFQLFGRVFTDFGSSGTLPEEGQPGVTDTKSLRASVGAGVTWISPFGPVGLDLGYAVLKEDFDQTELLRVNFGTKF